MAATSAAALVGGIGGGLRGRKGNRKMRDQLKSMDQKLDQIIEGGKNLVDTVAEPGEEGLASTAGIADEAATAITTGGFDDSTLNTANEIYGSEEERTTAAGVSAQQTAANAAAISGL